LRLFVALSLPDEVRLGLSHLCCGLPGVRWVAPENFHITLRFIGEIDGGTADDIDAALCGIRAPAFTLELAGVGHFGDDSKVRAVWAGVRPQPALQHLHDKIESAVVRAGARPDGQRFRPHVTLAWPNQPPPPSKMQAFLAQHGLYRSRPFEVTPFTIYSSFIGGEGPYYRAECSYELSRAMVSAK
jgi:2'-5' RNA ligase